ncbi:MAG: aspartate--tRNA ligase [Nanoarchaeota archaeon]|nr:aspartate--tRNA ligase [Nanoarchaeota archaeon]
MLRTHNVGEVNEKLSGKKVTLSGWVDTIREHGKLIFLDLRDRYGKVQCVVSQKNSDFKEAKKLTIESCVKIEGKVKERPKGTENKDLHSGKVEIEIEKIEILTLCEPLPFDIHDKTISEDLRLKYRYLDLRSERMQRNIQMRHKVIKFMRDFLDKKGFVEITTPILTKSSPEGARDFIVPSRIHPGKFYALPQSPQQYKQLLMVSGFDKYFQIAPCFRDEDARADRSPGEFYQLDMEMAFVEQEDILNVVEELYVEMIKKLFPEKKIQQVPFPRLKHDDVMKKYGTDKPDLRKNKNDANELAFAWVVDFPLFKRQEKNDFFHGAGKRWGPSHHMFTMPKKEDWKYLNNKDAGKARAYQHDLVLNGFEVGGGSIRIHLSDIQEKVFDLIGFEKKQKKYFEHMLTAFKYGVPPHGGIAPGIDRSLMVIMGEPNIRELIAFPKNKEARDVTFDAPDDVTEKQLKEVHIEIVKEKEKKGSKKK